MTLSLLDCWTVGVCFFPHCNDPPKWSLYVKDVDKLYFIIYNSYSRINIAVTTETRHFLTGYFLFSNLKCYDSNSSLRVKLLSFDLSINQQHWYVMYFTHCRDPSQYLRDSKEMRMCSFSDLLLANEAISNSRGTAKCLLLFKSDIRIKLNYFHTGVVCIYVSQKYCSLELILYHTEESTDHDSVQSSCADKDDTASTQKELSMVYSAAKGCSLTLCSAETKAVFDKRCVSDAANHTFTYLAMRETNARRDTSVSLRIWSGICSEQCFHHCNDPLAVEEVHWFNDTHGTLLTNYPDIGFIGFKPTSSFQATCLQDFTRVVSIVECNVQDKQEKTWCTIVLYYPLYFDLPRHSLSGNLDKLHLKIMPNEHKARANSLPQVYDYGRINICAVIKDYNGKKLPGSQFSMRVTFKDSSRIEGQLMISSTKTGQLNCTFSAMQDVILSKDHWQRITIFSTLNFPYYSDPSSCPQSCNEYNSMVLKGCRTDCEIGNDWMCIYVNFESTTMKPDARTFLNKHFYKLFKSWPQVSMELKILSGRYCNKSLPSQHWIHFVLCTEEMTEECNTTARYCKSIFGFYVLYTTTYILLANVLSVADNDLSHFLFALLNSQPIPPMTKQANWNAILLCTHYANSTGAQDYSHFSSIDGVIAVLHNGNHQNNETDHCLLISCTCVQVLKISRRQNARIKGKIYILHSYLL